MTVSNPTQSTSYKVGWWILIVLSVLMTLNHFSLLFIIPEEFVLFAGWTAFNLYALAVLYIPFRKGEKWAWNISWVFPIFTASPINGDPTIAPYYLGVAVIFALGLLLTMKAFTNKG